MVARATDIFRNSSINANVMTMPAGGQQVTWTDYLEPYGTRAYRLSTESRALSHSQLHRIAHQRVRSINAVRGTQSESDVGVTVGSNLIENGSFERMANPCSPDGFYLIQGSDIGASFLCDGTTAVDGRYSMRVTTPSNGTGLWFRPFPADISKPGTYELRMWAKASSNGVRLAFSASSNPSSTCIIADDPVQVSLLMTWQQYRVTLVCANAVGRTPVLEYSVASRGTAWVDKLELVYIL